MAVNLNQMAVDLYVTLYEGKMDLKGFRVAC